MLSAVGARLSHELARPGNYEHCIAVTASTILQKSHTTGLQVCDSLRMRARARGVPWDLLCRMQCVKRCILCPVLKPVTSEEVIAQHITQGYPVDIPPAQSRELMLDRPGESRGDCEAIYTDGSVKTGEQASCATAYLARTGEWKIKGWKLPPHTIPLHAEIAGILLAVMELHEARGHTLIVYTDCKRAAELINGESLSRDFKGSLVQEGGSLGGP